MTLNVESPRVYTRHGVPISVTGIAQVNTCEHYVVLLALGGSCNSTRRLGSSEEGCEVLPETISFLSNYFCTFKKGIPIVMIAVSLMKDSGNRFNLLMATKNTTTMKYMFF